MTVVGITTRTTNQAELSGESRIAKLWERFMSERIMEKIPNAVTPGLVIGLYTDYESDDDGEYTVLLGTQVKTAERLPDGLESREVKPATYAVIPSDTGKIPTIVIGAWKKVWGMTDSELGGRRAFTADFEWYDERSRNPNEAQLELFISIREG
jgi:predicted transcriptional regulator YdeE